MTRPTLDVSRGVMARLRRFSKQHDLIEPGQRVLAGVSGGPDSTCLLLVLGALRRSLKFDLAGAHFDHQLRGERAAAREERFVRNLANELDVPIVVGAGDVKGHARANKQSIEEAARELRYEFFHAAAAALDCDAVAVGHTNDDQAETVLLHLVRGSGLRGLAAMAPRSAWPFPTEDAPRLIRPLLDLTRDDTMNVCVGAGLTPIDDPSNRSDAHSRSRIRRDLMPLLRDLNPNIENALARLASAAADDVALLESLADELVTTGRNEEVRIDRKRLRAAPPAIQGHAVRLAARRALGDTRNVSQRHARAAIDLAAGPSGTQVHLARGLRVRATRQHLVFSTETPTRRPSLPKRPVRMPVPGRAKIGGWMIEGRKLKTRPREVKSRDPMSVVLDGDRAGARLNVRRRRDGDRFQPLGMSSEKKLQDFFVDAHVPREERDGVPLVVSEHGILWVVGQRPAEWAKVTATTSRYLRLTAKRS